MGNDSKSIGGNMAEIRENVLLYRSLRDAVKTLPVESRDNVLMAVLDYGLDNIEPTNLDACENALFIMTKPLIDRANARYTAQCQNGKKGGAPVGNHNALKKTTQNNPKQPKTTQNNLNDNDNDNVNDNDTDNDTLSITESDFANLPPLPLNDGKLFRLTTKDFEMYKQLYPAVDVEQQVNSMVAWLNSNPTRRKTKNGIKKFVNGWLAKEQDRAPRHNAKQNNASAEMDEAFRQLAEMRKNGEI